MDVFSWDFHGFSHLQHNLCFWAKIGMEIVAGDMWQENM